jgi:ribose-phosphate pyrophosphokinase
LEDDVMLMFSLEPQAVWAAEVAATLDQPLAPLEERRFTDGECKLRPLVDPCGEDAYVLFSLHGGPQDSPHDKLCRLLMFIATLREHGAARVTAVVPYLAYARKDRQTKPHDPVTLRYVAQMFESVGTDQIMVLEVHNVAAFQNAFRCVTLHIDSHPAFDAVVRELAGGGPLAVASPDPGGVKRAQLWREALEHQLQAPVGFAMVDKRRSAGVVSGTGLVGDVHNANVLIVDDLIASGGTMVRAGNACREAGARAVYAFAAHGLFTGGAADALRHPALSGFFIADTVPPFRLPPDVLKDHVNIVSAAPIFADAMHRLHAGGSINELLTGES